MTAAGRGPVISVVLPVAGVEEFLVPCLDSVLGQDVPGVEVIAVDDASPDGCGEILDSRAARDPRLRVVHLPRRAGPGPARMCGLAHASGEYVWFVDPDDLAADGALALIARRLAAEHPDLLLLDYLVLRASGATERSSGHALLRAAPSAGLTLAGRPALIDRTMTSWSRVYRRRFLEGLGVAFPAGIHEDVPVSAAAALAARRISLVGEVCYLYRRREGSFLARPGPEHFSIFASYESVFAFMDAGAGGTEVTPAVRVAVFGRAMEHYTTVLAAGLIPRQSRAEYFRRMTRDFGRYRPPGYIHPPGPRGMKLRLVERGDYRIYTALEPINAVRVGLRRTASRLTGRG